MKKNVSVVDSVQQKCPFGAIGTKTWITNVIADLKAGKKVYAILAPATEGQFGKDITNGKLETGSKERLDLKI